MAIHTATPTTLGAIETRAQTGDTILLEAGVYTQRPNRPGVTYQAVDWAEGRVLRGTIGHLGNGMAVHFRTTFNLTAPGMTIRGVFHDTRGFGTINAGVISASGIVLEDCSAAARPNSGTRQIGYTLGTGAIRVSGIRFTRCRHHPTGQPGQALDHAFYLKNCTGNTFTDCLIYDGGRFPFHLYTDADNNRMERCVVWGSLGCVTFSGAADATTGTTRYGTSDNNLMTGCILGQASRGALIESWTSDPSRPVIGNVVQDTMVWPRPGGPVWDGKPGVTTRGLVTRDPGFRDPARGDFTRTGTYDGYGPTYLYQATTPPPPPPPPPPPDPPSEDPRLTALRADLAVIRQRHTELGALIDQARNRIP